MRHEPTVCIFCGRNDTRHLSRICDTCTGPHRNENAQQGNRGKPRAMNADGTKRVVAPGPAADENDDFDLDNSNG